MNLPIAIDILCIQHSLVPRVHQEPGYEASINIDVPCVWVHWTQSATTTVNTEILSTCMMPPHLRSHTRHSSYSYSSNYDLL